MKNLIYLFLCVFFANTAMAENRLLLTADDQGGSKAIKKGGKPLTVEHGYEEREGGFYYGFTVPFGGGQGSIDNGIVLKPKKCKKGYARNPQCLAKQKQGKTIHCPCQVEPVSKPDGGGSSNGFCEPGFFKLPSCLEAQADGSKVFCACVSDPDYSKKPAPYEPGDTYGCTFSNDREYIHCPEGVYRRQTSVFEGRRNPKPIINGEEGNSDFQPKSQGGTSK